MEKYKQDCPHLEYLQTQNPSDHPECSNCEGTLEKSLEKNCRARLLEWTIQYGT